MIKFKLHEHTCNETRPERPVDADPAKSMTDVLTLRVSG